MPTICGLTETKTHFQKFILHYIIMSHFPTNSSQIFLWFLNKTFYQETLLPKYNNLY